MRNTRILQIAGLWLLFISMFVDITIADAVRENIAVAVSWSELGAVAGKQYHGDGLTVTATANRARLQCIFQRLEGKATSNGLWLESKVDDRSGTCFSVKATGLGRTEDDLTPLCATGNVEVEQDVARFIRPELVEEYTVGIDGIRQDFVVLNAPDGEGNLQVILTVVGAHAEPAADGARLVLENSGRRLIYNRLKVTDARKRELSARLVVESRNRLAVIVDDADAVYPVWIDPTFSDEDWCSMGAQGGVPGMSRYVNKLVVDRAGNLYAGGLFTNAGGVAANHIAKWNGSTWSALGSGVNGAVNALAVDGSGNLYAGGDFTNAGNVAVNHIAKWDGNAWSALGAGMFPTQCLVSALVIDGAGNLYAGGDFTNAGGVAVNYIAKWDGNTWSALGSGLSGYVYTLVKDGAGNLYAGGGFTNAGGTAANRIAKWDGSAWSALAQGMNDEVNALVLDGSGNLYAGGVFTNASGVTANRIAKWDGSAWSALGSGMSGYLSSSNANYGVTALALDGSGNLYAGGFFTNAGEVAVNHIAKWDGSIWSTLCSGMGDAVNALVASGSTLYVGGAFSTADNITVNYIAQWDNSWHALSSGLNFPVYALEVAGSDLYAGGCFSRAGEILVNNIAKWDGNAWSALGSGIDMAGASGPLSVCALKYDYGSESLYVGGCFTRAGGVTVNNIAKWDGSAWSTLGSGVTPPGQGSDWSSVRALALDSSGGILYAGGLFTNAGGVAANNIAKWDGGAWSALGSGLNKHVYVLAVDRSGNLYVGGKFTTAGSVAANCIAKWDGTNWSALGSGVTHSHVNNLVNSLALDSRSGILYAGGYFTNAGEVAANYIAKWDGSAWSALGSGMNSPVCALALDGSGNLYAAGLFTNVSGMVMNYIAKWDGSAWSALGSGLNNQVYALALDGVGKIYVGGYFTTAGGKPSSYAAYANIPDSATRTPVTGDIEGDRLVDLITVVSTNWYVWFSSAQYQVRGGPYVLNISGTPLTGDIDGDSKADLIVVSATGGWYVWLSPSGYTQRIGPYALGISGTPATGDIDGDGKADLIEVVGSNWYVWFSSFGYTQRIGPCNLGIAGTPLTGDIDGDGRADLISVVGSNWYVWFSTSQYLTRCGPYALGISGTPATGDIDGDGRADLISVVGSNWYVWFSTADYLVRGGPYTLSVE